MISKCADKVTNFFVRKSIIICEEKEIYKYGFELIISTGVNLFWVLIIGFIYKEIILALVAFMIFATVRTQCGGYHANTYFKCNLFLIIVFNMIMFVAHYFNTFYMHKLLYILLYFYIPIFLWVFSPISSLHNTIETEYEKKQIKIKVLKRTFIWEILGLVCWGLGWKDLTALVITTFGAVCILLALEMERRKSNEKNC